MEELNLCLTDDNGCSFVKETLDEELPINFDPLFNIPDGDVTLIVIIHLSNIVLSTAYP